MLCKLIYLIVAGGLITSFKELLLGKKDTPIEAVNAAPTNQSKLVKYLRLGARCFMLAIIGSLLLGMTTGYSAPMKLGFMLLNIPFYFLGIHFELA